MEGRSTALGAGAVMELKRHQNRLCRTHEQSAAAERHRDQDDDEEPVWGIEGELGPEGEPHDDRAPDEDHEGDRTVAGLFGVEVEAAIRAGGRGLQETRQQLALAAVRANTGEAGGYR